MRTDLFRKLTWSLLLVAGPAMFTLAQAQSDKTKKSDDSDNKASIRVRVTEEVDGKTRNVEKSYRVGALSDDERQKFVDKVLDSLGVDKKKKQAISITIDDGDDGVISMNKRKKVIIDHRDDREPTAFLWDREAKDDFKFENNWNADKFREHFKHFEKDFRPKARLMLRDMEDLGSRMGDIWEGTEMGKAANVRSLNAYANNPADDVLNLRFAVPEKGDVTVTVTDVKGREVGKKDIKDFEGEYVGQIELKKNTKGTLFVTVVQNEDGAVKRVVIP